MECEGCLLPSLLSPRWLPLKGASEDVSKETEGQMGGGTWGGGCKSSLRGRDSDCARAIGGGVGGRYA